MSRDFPPGFKRVIIEDTETFQVTLERRSYRTIVVMQYWQKLKGDPEVLGHLDAVEGGWVFVPLGWHPKVVLFGHNSINLAKTAFFLFKHSDSPLRPKA